MKTSEEEFIKQTKSVFENYDDGYSENGWIELRKKFPEKENKKLPIWWLTGVAATLLLVAGLYFGDAFDTEKVVLRAENIKPNTSINKPQVENYKTEPNIASVPKTAGKPSNTSDHIIQKNNYLPNKKAVVEELVVAANKPIINDDAKKSDDLKNNSIDNQPKSPPIIDNKNAIASVQIDNTITEKNNIEGKNEVLEKNTKSIDENKPKKLSTEEFLTEQSKMIAANANNKKDSKKTEMSKTTIDVFTGTFFNYHDNNEAKLSAGVGLNANMKITKNLTFSFGAGISQNKVNYENQVPARVAEAMFATTANAPNSAPVNGMSYSATATNDVSLNGRLLSIDLPMVIKLFPTNKQDFYISTGINSSTYLSQRYTFNYSYSNFAVQNGMAQQQQQTEKSNLGGFDFANSAIIAVGINQNFGKHIIIFEPYYRPALNTMGNKDLRISAAGLNLKFNFNGAKR